MSDTPTANKLIQRVIDDCYSWEDWDTTDRHNFEAMATILENAQKLCKEMEDKYGL